MSVPAWDREVDIVFCRIPVSSTIIQGPESSNASETRSAESSNITETDAETESPRPDSDARADTEPCPQRQEQDRLSADQTFRRAVTALYQRGRQSDINRANKNFFPCSLPDNVRHRIWDYVMSDDPDKAQIPIRTQSFEPFYRGVWEDTNFQSIQKLLLPCAGALRTSAAMRAEVLAYLLTTRRFHFVFSPYVTRNISPQMFHWIDHYSHLMEYMTVEIDLSKLGFGADPDAASLRWGLQLILGSIRQLVAAQLEKRTIPLDTLVVIARRYHGRRLAVEGQTEAPLYCPPEADFTAVTPLLNLRGRIRTLRLAGFNASTTNTTITSMFPEMDFGDKDRLQNHCTRADVSTIWPFLPGQVSVHHEGKIPRDKLTRAVPLPMVTTTKKVALARKQIEKLKEMLEVHDLQKNQDRQVSLELENELGGSRISDGITIQRRRGAPSLARLGDSIKRDSRLRPRVDSPMLSPHSPMLETHPTVEEKRQSYASYASYTSTPSIQIDDLSETQTPTPREPSFDHVETSRSLTRDVTPTNQSKRNSQASTGSLRSTRSLRWLTREGRRGRKDSARSSKDDSLMELFHDDGPSIKNLEKKDSVKKLHRKRSFIDVLRGRERPEAPIAMTEPDIPELPQMLAKPVVTADKDLGDQGEGQIRTTNDESSKTRLRSQRLPLC